MDSQKYHVEMEQWKEDLRAAQNQVSLGVLSNYRFYIFSQFSMNHFYQHFEHILYCRVLMLKVTILEKSYKIFCLGNSMLW